MKGRILDIYPEGKNTFRACGIEELENHMVKVINLDTGEISVVEPWEIGETIIEDIFTHE